MSKTNFKIARVAMVDSQIRPADVTHYNIIDSMLRVPREEFFPESLKELAYVGESIQIAPKRYSLDPRIIAKMLNLLNIKESDLVLDIAGGYGYTACLLSYFAQAVVLSEEPHFVKEAERVLGEQSIDNVIVKSGELHDGANEFGLYDVIIIEGGIDFVPDLIIEQLKIGGRIAAVFINKAVGECWLGFRTDDAINWRFGFNAFAPHLENFKLKEQFIF
jgi:protein-L-isoaspartate(D-aspartate) O-methyltransferase